MKRLKEILAIMFWLVVSMLQPCAQGYIVPNGVNYVGLNFLGGYEVRVIHNPNNLDYTGFWLTPQGKTLPTVYTNTFSFDSYLDVGVRAFLVVSNDTISLQPILANSYTELLGSNYVFNNQEPFYVGLYTGNDIGYPPNGIYEDPLFGWARLVNNQGVIQLLDSALVYKAEGIFAGTQNSVPEPSGLALAALGALLLGRRRSRNWRS